MRKAITLIILVISFLGYSQKIKLKKGEVLVDDVAWLNYQECGSFDNTCSLLNKNNDELVFFKWINVPGAEPMTQYNKDGTLRYVEIVFVGAQMKIELQKTQKDCIELLYNGKVVNEDGTLNMDKVSRMVEKYGTPFSDRLNRSSNSPGTIIINNNQSPQRSGVNINLGR
ncbi:hypothetical protein OX284_002200 [Flavobacterium sp. SUN046]|uniref:hypothetical protein n=1 Tax=Flavobacterium sp. SUN046 TaxID=3002440 RepID=UPI002DBA55E0|nr:hypothetical protein [Flavobacterium sp. SUN046]MEC4048227.1 hypothetical protein [Flavobacterium sp. SUN046]